MVLNNNATTIGTTVSTAVADAGVTLSEAMANIWGEGRTASEVLASANNGVINVIKMYGDNFTTANTTLQESIDKIKIDVASAVAYANKKAQAEIDAINQQRAEQEAASQPATPVPEPTPTPSASPGGDGTPNIGDEVTFEYGDYYYSSDGLTPTGSEMHGEKVYITHINDADWASKQYHISRDREDTRPLGWVDLSQISGYESGIKSVPKDQLALTNEGGKPETIVLKDGSILTPLSAGDSVLNHAAHENLWNIANDPTKFIHDASVPEVPNISNVMNQSQNNTITINIPIEKVNDYNDFITKLQNDKNAEKMIQGMVLDPLVGKGNFGKYRYKWQ